MLFTLCDDIISYIWKPYLAHVSKTHTPDPTQILSRASLKDMHIEAMTYAMRSRGNTGDTRTHNGDLWSVELGVGRRRCGR